MPEFELPVGPQHPALKEPESFRLKIDGEIVVEADVRLGYNHRGIEKACETRTYTQCLYLVERICGICSHAHATAFSQAVEALLGLEIPRRARYIRTIAAELERVHSHLLWLGVAGHEVGFDTLFMYAWRDREAVQDILEIISGNRVNYGLNTIGGVRRDIDPLQKESILGLLEPLTERTSYYARVVQEEGTFRGRVDGVGNLSKDMALALNAVGPQARGSGVPMDVRKDDPYAAYDEMPFKVITSERGDVLGRALVRVLELLESYKIIRHALENLPDGPIAVKAPKKVPAGETVSRYEAPRGENFHYVKANGSETPERVKVRAPTLANIPSLVHILKGAHLADVPIITAAIDPCFSCTDRKLQIAPAGGSGDPRVMTWEELRQYGIRWYKDHAGRA
ncbi:MAG: nickel-dependent hydrogenase large subunit [Bacteroidota bacterium]